MTVIPLAINLFSLSIVHRRRCTSALAVTGRTTCFCCSYLPAPKNVTCINLAEATSLSQLCSAKSEKGCITSAGVARGAEMPKDTATEAPAILPHNNQRLNNPESIYFNGYIIYTICQRRDIKYCVRDVEQYLLQGRDNNDSHTNLQLQ